MIIPKEELSSFQRWQAGSFDKKAPPAAARVEPAAAPAVEPGETATATAVPISLPTAEDIERIYEEARASGYAAGLAEGQASGEQIARDAAEAVRQNFSGLIDNLNKALDTLDQSVADELLALAIEIAAQVTRGAISAKTDVLLPVVREAIATLPLHHSHIVLRLHPEDAKNLRTLLGDEFSQTGTQIFEDSEISRGGCHLQAGASEVDASIETRWRRVIESIGADPRPWLNL